MFMQYECRPTEDQLHNKYQTVALATATIMLVAFLFTLVVYYLQTTSKLDLLQYDISTVTASDYTVEMDITPAMYKDF